MIKIKIRYIISGGIYSLTIITLLLISCVGTNNKYGYKYGNIDSRVISNITNDTTVFSDNAKYIDIKCSSEIIENNTLISDFELIPLETTQASYVGNVDKIVVRDSMIYLLDINQTKSLKVFNITNGQFVCQIGNFGKSNAEYIEPTDFAVTDNRVFILDNTSKKILEYDFKSNFFKSIRLQFSLQSINTFNNDSIFICTAGDNRHLSAIDKYKVLMIDLNGNIISKYFKTDFDLNYCDLHNLKSYENFAWYHASYSNEIGCIVNSISKVEYKLRFDKKMLPHDFEKKCNGDFGNFIDNYRNVNSYVIGECCHTDRYLFFQYANQGQSGNMLVYDKIKDSVVYNGTPSYNSNKGNFKEYIMMRLDSAPRFVSGDNDIYGMISSERAHILNNKEMVKKMIKKDSIMVTDNPIIFKMKFL